jgi:hypothetical protein
VQTESDHKRPGIFRRTGGAIAGGFKRAEKAVEGDQGFHPRERLALILGFVGFTVLCGVVVWKIAGAGYGLGIVVLAGVIAALVGWLTIKIESDLYIIPELDPHRLENPVTFLYLPHHQYPEWDIKGNVPALRNTTDGGRVYFAETFSTQERTITMCHNPDFSSVKFLTDIGLLQKLVARNATLEDQNENYRITMPLEIQRNTGLVIDDLMHRIFIQPESLKNRVNYGQGRADENGNKSFTLMPRTIDEAERNTDEELEDIVERNERDENYKKWKSKNAETLKGYEGAQR